MKYKQRKVKIFYLILKYNLIIQFRQYVQCNKKLWSVVHFFLKLFFNIYISYMSKYYFCFVANKTTIPISTPISMYEVHKEQSP